MVYELLPPRRQTGKCRPSSSGKSTMSDVFRETEQRLFGGVRRIRLGAAGEDVGVHGEDDARRGGLAQAGHGRMNQRRRAGKQQPRRDPEREGAMFQVALAHGARVREEKAIQDLHILSPTRGLGFCPGSLENTSQTLRLYARYVG